MDYRIIRSRRKSVSIEITPRKEVLVRCPNRMPVWKIRQFVAEKENWITAHLSKLPSVDALTPQEHQALIRSAKDRIPCRVAFFAEAMKVSFGHITVRSQHTRWGSCSAAGNLSFNCLLMLAPPEIQDYVIVHELCHRKEMNHSDRFWAEVEAVLPDYRSRRQWLKENGASLLARLPDPQK